jgi:hypothetical protein
MTRLRKILAAGVLTAACAFAAQSAQASLIVNAAVGGAPTGVNYVNFDDLALGGAGGTSGGIGVSFTGDAQVVTGASGGFYAAPFLSNSNGALFGDATVSGADTTHYLSTGIGTVTLDLPATQTYFGLLWGSVDSYNSLQFYNGSTLVGTVTGSDVTAGADGNQGAMGTFYVNILSTLGFDRVVALSSDYAFELDNVAFNPTNPNNPVPEPLTIGLLGLGILGLGAIRRRA